MKSSWKRFAPYLLYLSLLGMLAAVILYIIQRQFNLPLQIALAVVVLGLAGYAILNPGGVRQALSGRQARYGSNAVIMVLAFIGILVVINYIANANSKRWDLTEDKQHTLAEETVTVLNRLPGEVTALAFFQASADKQATEDLLNNFSYNSKGKFTYRFIDPDEDPVTAQNAKITRYSSVVLEMEGRQELAKYNTEEEVAAALIRLMNPGERVVYFLTGHGEYDPSGTGERSYSLAKRTLESKNYTVNSLNLLIDPQIPQDTLALIIAGSMKPLSDNEITIIRDYLAAGGSLFVMVEPKVMTQAGDTPDPLLSYLSSEWGISADDDLVVDLGANPPTIAIGDPQTYASHPVTNDLKSRNIVTLFPTARSLQSEENTGLNPVVLMTTTDQSWGEVDLAGLQNNEVSADPNSDILGPVSLAYAIEKTDNGARLVIVGDSDFAADGNFEAYGNGDLFANIIDWAAEQEDLISLTPKETTTRVMITPTQTTMGLILFGSVFVLPGLTILAGILTWLSRRKRG